jgi:hypothetical protein
VTPTLTIDTRGFAAMAKDLARRGGVPVQQAIDAETGKVLEVAVRYTSAPKASRYPRQPGLHASDGQSEIYVNAGIKSGAPAGRVWLTEQRTNKRTGHPKTHYIIAGAGADKRWSDARWARAQGLLAQAEQAAGLTAKQVAGRKRKRKIEGRGLAKQSWVQIANSMDLKLAGVPDYVRNARAQGGRSFVNGMGRRLKQGSTLFNEIENRYPLLVSGGRKPGAGTQGHAILQRAIRTRLSAFKNALRHGVFNDMKDRSAKYPGIFVKP